MKQQVQSHVNYIKACFLIQNLVTFGFVHNLDIISCSWHFGIYRLFSARLHSPFCVFRWLECREDGVARDVWAVRVFGREIFVYHQISKNVRKYRLQLLHIIRSYRSCQRREIVQFTSSNFNDWISTYPISITCGLGILQHKINQMNIYHKNQCSYIQMWYYKPNSYF